MWVEHLQWSFSLLEALKCIRTFIPYQKPRTNRTIGSFFLKRNCIFIILEKFSADVAFLMLCPSTSESQLTINSLQLKIVSQTDLNISQYFEDKDLFLLTHAGSVALSGQEWHQFIPYTCDYICTVQQWGGSQSAPRCKFSCCLPLLHGHGLSTHALLILSSTIIGSVAL